MGPMKLTSSFARTGGARWAMRHQTIYSGTNYYYLLQYSKRKRRGLAATTAPALMTH
jgi:hypothetical protein